MQSTNLELNMVIQLRKPHPCGGSTWQIIRLGADIGLVCLTCQRKIIVPRGKLLKQIKAIVPK